MYARIFWFVVFSAFVLPAAAQNAEGDWQGTLALPNGGDLRLVFHIRKDADRYGGTMDSPDQGASGIPLGAIKADGASLAFDVPSLRGEFRGTWDDAGNQWRGDWMQSGLRLALNLTRANGSPAQTPESLAGLNGDWDGILDTGTVRLRLVIHISVTKTVIAASMDSIDQGVNGLPITSVRQDGSTVKIELSAIAAGFEGTLDAGGQTIIGRWTQGGTTLPLTLARRAKGASTPVPRRPQMPKGPFPYRSESVSYDNPSAKVRLAGTLTLPQGAGPFPAVLLVAGSGPLDRDESLFGHKPFLVLADYLTRQGIAVLRVDKRGIGQSTGDFSSATSTDFASDVEAGIAFLRSRSDIDASKLGLVGHSEGGLIAPLVASRDSALAYVVLLAGPGVSGLEILLDQFLDVAQAGGLENERTAPLREFVRKAMTVIVSAPTAAEGAAQARELMRSTTDILGLPGPQIDRIVGTWSSPWFRYFLAHDPAPVLRKVNVPVLALNGSLDVQVRAGPNLAGIREALAHNANTEVHEMPGLNHLFQTATTGSVAEYGSIEETLAPAALKLVSTWIAARGR
jgi:alpha-beta hydrolase superfamily lysophospholipase